jgi:ketosteroid isomerase-like protein
MTASTVGPEARRGRARSSAAAPLGTRFPTLVTGPQRGVAFCHAASLTELGRFGAAGRLDVGRQVWEGSGRRVAANGPRVSTLRTASSSGTLKERARRHRGDPLKRAFIFIAFVAAMPSTTLGETNSNRMQEEIRRAEKEFSQAIVKNDAEAVGRFLADDWIIIDPDGGIIDRASFLGVIQSGTLTHEMMDSDDTRVRIYGNTAVVTALTKTKGKFSGQAFTTQERATDVFVKQDGRWRCVLSHLTRFTKK